MEFLWLIFPVIFVQTSVDWQIKYSSRRKKPFQSSKSKNPSLRGIPIENKIALATDARKSNLTSGAAPPLGCGRRRNLV